MQQHSAWKRADERGSRAAAIRPKRGGGAMRIMILDKADVALKVAQISAHVLIETVDIAFEQAVIHGFVVGVIEALLLKRILHIPICFGDEEEFGVARFDLGDNGLPVIAAGRL